MRRSDYPPPFDQLPAAAAELAMGLAGGATAPRPYGLKRTDLSGDSVSTVSDVPVTANMTFLALYDATHAGSLRSLIFGWSRTGTGGVAFHANGTTLEFQVASTTGATSIASGAMSGAMTTLGETFYWGTINGTALRTGYGDPAVNTPWTATLSGTGPNPIAGEKGYILRRTTAPTIESAGTGIFAVLSRTMSDGEKTALFAGPESVADALAAFLTAEELLGNVRWWPAPRDDASAGESLPLAADIPDLSGNEATLVVAVSSRITAEVL